MIRQPQVILKLVGTGKGTAGIDPGELQDKTGIPVVVLKYGDLGTKKEELYASLRIMAEVVGKTAAGGGVIRFFDDHIADLKKRTADIAEAASGHRSTSAGSPMPDRMAFNRRNRPIRRSASSGPATSPRTPTADQGRIPTDIAKEKIVEWNPDILFLDLATLQLGDEAGGLYELRTDPAYQTLTAVRSGQVYGVLPYNWYNQKFESIFANAYFIGKLLYPERFTDIDPAAKADEIYTFMVGKPVFAEMNGQFRNLAFRIVPLVTCISTMAIYRRNTGAISGARSAFLFVLALMLAGPRRRGLARGGQRSIPAVAKSLFGMETTRQIEIIVWNIRLPQALATMVAGAGLAVAGAAMQSIFRNPLGSPFTLGISHGAAFGAALSVMVLGGGMMTSTASARCRSPTPI